MKEPRAVYTWGIDGSILWLEDNGKVSRSLTNDIKSCLSEVAYDLPAGKSLFDYTIIYRDSDGRWDGIKITGSEADEGDPQTYRVDFFSVGKSEFREAKEAVLNNRSR